MNLNELKSFVDELIDKGYGEWECISDGYGYSLTKDRIYENIQDSIDEGKQEIWF